MNRLCIHTITTKPLSLEQCLREYPRRGATGITIWRQSLEGRDGAGVRRQAADAGLQVRPGQCAGSKHEGWVTINSRYLMDILGQVEGDVVEVHLADAAAPTLIRENDKASALYVLMPMRV